MLETPGGQISYRPLYFTWLCDCSGSMSVEGKMASLNQAIRDTLPGLRSIARENPYAAVLMRAIRFSHGASWLSNQYIPLSDFVWTDLTADPLTNPELDVVFLIDTSGSMEDEIDGVKNSCQQFADQIMKENIDIHIGMIGFDIGGHRSNLKELRYRVKNLSHYTIGTWNITTPEIFKNHVNQLRVGLFGGAGCYIANQDTVDIFPEIVNLFKTGRNSAKRVLVIISDEMGDREGLKKIVDILREEQIRAYVLGVSDKNGAHQQIANITEGLFWDIFKSRGEADFSILFRDVADTIARETKKAIGDGKISSGTDMGAAVRLLSTSLKMPPMPERALPPVQVLISDGKPTDDFPEALNELIMLPWGRKSVKISIGIGKDADINTLRLFNSNKELEPLVAYDPEDLIRMIRWASSEALRLSSKPRIGETKPYARNETGQKHKSSKWNEQ